MGDVTGYCTEHMPSEMKGTAVVMRFSKINISRIRQNAVENQNRHLSVSRKSLSSLPIEAVFSNTLLPMSEFP